LILVEEKENCTPKNIIYDGTMYSRDRFPREFVLFLFVCLLLKFPPPSLHQYAKDEKNDKYTNIVVIIANVNVHECMCMSVKML